ncbi:hypothetical protein LEN26_003201 [Aphanomyces euteiches]|nr:hypothetical protein LEN26_003201 [Aphanomyces euteiches]
MRLFVSLALAMSAVVALNQPSQDSPVMLAHQDSVGSAVRLLQGSRAAKGGREGKKRPNGKHQKKGSKTFQQPNRGSGKKFISDGEGGPRNPGGKLPSFSSLQE